MENRVISLIIEWALLVGRPLILVHLSSDAHGPDDRSGERYSFAMTIKSNRWPPDYNDGQKVASSVAVMAKRQQQSRELFSEKSLIMRDEGFHDER